MQSKLHSNRNALREGSEIKKDDILRILEVNKSNEESSSNIKCLLQNLESNSEPKEGDLDVTESVEIINTKLPEKTQEYRGNLKNHQKTTSMHSMVEK